jgi:hypothetical protein
MNRNRILSLAGIPAFLVLLAVTGMLVSVRLHSQTAPATPAQPNVPAVVGVSVNPTGSCTMQGNLQAPTFVTVNLSTGAYTRCLAGTWVTDAILMPSSGVLQYTGGIQLVDATGALNSNVAGESPVYSAYGSMTTANLNTGTNIVPPVTGRTLKVLQFDSSTTGGAATTCTAIVLEDTAPVVAISTTVAAYSGAGVQVTTSTAPAAGAMTFTTFLSALTANAGLKLASTGSACTVMTALNYKVLYTVQ